MTEEEKRESAIHHHLIRGLIDNGFAHATHRLAYRSPVASPGWRDQRRSRLHRCRSGGSLVASRSCGRRSDRTAARTSMGLADALLLSHGRHQLLR
jgi:hypothetical protein